MSKCTIEFIKINKMGRYVNDKIYGEKVNKIPVKEIRECETVDFPPFSDTKKKNSTHNPLL